MSNKLSTIITLSLSFILSSLAYMVAQPENLPIQHYEFEEIIIYPSTKEDVNDDSDIDWTYNFESWCSVHPDECLIDTNLYSNDKNDEDAKHDEEYGC